MCFDTFNVQKNSSKLKVLVLDTPYSSSFQTKKNTAFFNRAKFINYTFYTKNKERIDLFYSFFKLQILYKKKFNDVESRRERKHG